MTKPRKGKKNPYREAYRAARRIRRQPPMTVEQILNEVACKCEESVVAELAEYAKAVAKLLENRT